MEDENRWQPGHGHSSTATGSKVKEEHKRSRRHAQDPKPSHSTTLSGSRVKEELETSHGQEGKRPSSPQAQTEANKEERQVDTSAVLVTTWFNLRGIIQSVFWIAFLLLCFITLLRLAPSKEASAWNAQPRSSLTSVLPSHDLAVVKSHSDTVCFALNRLALGPTLDNASGDISFNESRVAVLNNTSKLTRGIQEVDLLGSFIARELSPSIKTNVHTGNCSLLASTRPIAQTAQVHFRDTLDSLSEILSSHNDAVAALRASRLGVQQALNNADKEVRTWTAFWGQKGDKESGNEKRRHFTVMETWRDMLDDAIERLLTGREIVSLKVNRYGLASADFDILVERLEMMAGLTESHCGISEVEVVERLFKTTVSKAANDDKGAPSFEGYYDAI